MNKNICCRIYNISILPSFIDSPSKNALSGRQKKKTGNCEENRSFVECGVIFWIFENRCLFLVLNNIFIQELSLLYGEKVLKSTTFCIKFL